MIKSKTIFLSVSLAAVLLTGCGSSTSPSTEANKALLKGVAVDDLIVNGKVKAYDPQNPTVILAEGRTDQNDGSYALKVEHEGIVVIEVTCDDKSKMKNPATGEIKVCEQNIKLHSAAALSKEKKEVIVNISPITELVVRQMEDRGVSKENLESAQSNIGQMFGFDPLGENPVKNDQYVKVINAVHQLAEQETDKSILEVVEKLSEDLVDGEAGDDGDITHKFAEAMAAAGANNNLTANHGRYKPEEAAAGSSSGGSTSSSGGSTSSSGGSSSGGGATAPTDIEISKQFFNELRTQAMSLTDYQNSGTPGFLDVEAEYLGYTLENITMNTKTAGSYAVGLVSDIVHLIAMGKTEDEKEISENISIAYKKESELVWSYKITENGEEKYEGTVTLPAENPENISIPDFTGALQVKFDGTVPLEGDIFDEPEYGSASGSGSSTLESAASTAGTEIQEVHADIALEKKEYGADFVLNNVSLTSAGTTIAIKDILINAYYGFDAEDELQMGHILFKQATVSVQTGTYTLNGKIEVPEYVQNNSINDKDFMTEEYTTFVNGHVVCLSEHNERIYEIENGSVFYTDQGSSQHPVDLSSSGYFWADIDGNVENLDPEEYGHSASTGSMGIGQDYDKYIGLTFDNLAITSDNCDNIKLEFLDISVNRENNNTTVFGEAFCVKDGQRTDIEGGNVVYTDKYGNPHEPVADTKDDNFETVKFNPLKDWSLPKVEKYLYENNIPQNELHTKGFISIGCQPCTRAIKKGEDLRAGRWWWEEPESKECGLHIK